jgi:hypothetical protein
MLAAGTSDTAAFVAFGLLEELDFAFAVEVCGP